MYLVFDWVILYFLVDLPKITLHETRSWDEIPSIDIEFPDGHIDALILQRFYSSEEERRSQELNCNFFGRLANSPGACVTVTGCPGREDLELTINSKHSGPSNMYILRKNGELEVVESLFKVLQELTCDFLTLICTFRILVCFVENTNFLIWH